MDAANTADRRRWMSTLSKSPGSRLTEIWEAGDDLPRPAYRLLRAPEVGLVMLRGRAGGRGNRFNLGEMTVTRCAVRLESGETGLSYLSGRDKHGAEIAAVLDAMMQSDEWVAQATPIVAALDAEQAEARQTTARRREATRVEFFTITRSREQK